MTGISSHLQLQGCEFCSWCCFLILVLRFTPVPLFSASFNYIKNLYCDELIGSF
uniref:Uncharacterized protein n=1 Tax=Anguilla anguilla TaxID=7936 RepID=A0A0E9UT46_ANGAN